VSAPCELVEDFFDGELAPSQAEEFREHAATCANCQRELMVLAQLRALEVNHRPGLETGAGAARPSPTAVALRPRPPRWSWAAGGAAAAIAAMLLVWVGWSAFLDRVPRTAFYPAVSHRLTDGRSADPRAREHRPRGQGVLGASGEEPAVLGHEAFAMLERRKDRLGLAAAHLARGTEADAEAAFKVLKGAGESADVLSERALAHLVRADLARGNDEARHRAAEEALELADRALGLDPRHGPALWNRALALEALELRLAAARAFAAMAELEEPGWAQEARGRARELRGAMEATRSTWIAAYRAGRKMVETGTLPDRDLLGVPVLRSFFYDAVRARTSKPEVEGLLPLARELDARAGAQETALQAYVARVASRDFATRGPLAAEYRRLALDQAVDATALLQGLRKAGEADLLLGALEKLPQAERTAEELDALARDAGKDPWLATLARRLQARALAKAGRASEAQAAFERARQMCLQARLGYQCGEVELAFTHFLDHAFELEQAAAHARRGWELIQRVQDWGLQLQFMLELAQLARRQEDFSTSRAYYEEAIERDGGATPEQRRFAYEGLANIDVRLLRFDDARRHIDAALETGLPLGLPGALALADIARVRPDRERDAAAMETFRRRLPELGENQRAMAEHALGRWAIERDREEGLRLLRGAIGLAAAADPGLDAADPAARQALAYSYTSLIFDAGRRRDAEGALRLFEEEWRLGGGQGALPERCLLAVTTDDECDLAVVRGAAGGPPAAFYDASRREPLPRELSGFLPPDAIRLLRGCPRVSVLARAPIHGRPGLLPGDLAWSYRGGGAAQQTRPAGGPRQHLVVQDVALSKERSPLRTPPPWNVPGLRDEMVGQLTRGEATPSAVKRRMEDANDITIIAHGEVRPESDEAYLVLAPEPGGDALRASDVRKLQLRGQPLVVLVACQVAQPAPVLHEARSLPSAFLRAGAQAVLAASDQVPERDGPELFGEVRRRIHDGAAPAEALRDERSRWLREGRGGAWLDGVLLFE